jgi:hypothetical protein
MALATAACPIGLLQSSYMSIAPMQVITQSSHAIHEPSFGLIISFLFSNLLRCSRTISRWISSCFWYTSSACTWFLVLMKGFSGKKGLLWEVERSPIILRLHSHASVKVEIFCHWCVCGHIFIRPWTCNRRFLMLWSFAFSRNELDCLDVPLPIRLPSFVYINKLFYRDPIDLWWCVDSFVDVGVVPSFICGVKGLNKSSLFFGLRPWASWS